MLARATLNGLAGRVVARGPPVAYPCSGNLKNAKNYFIEAKMYKLTESVIPRQTAFQPWASEGFFLGGDQ